MWRKFFRRSDFSGATHREMTTLQFPAEFHRNANPIEFAQTIARWDEFSRLADVQQRMAAMLDEAEHRTLVGLTMYSADLADEMATSLKTTVRRFRSSMSWRVTAPVRAAGSLLRRVRRRSATPDDTA